MGNLFSGIFGGGKQKQPALPPPPQAPNMAQIEADEKKKQQQKLAANTNTVYTTPLGINDTSLNTEKKNLLGG